MAHIISVVTKQPNGVIEVNNGDYSDVVDWQMNSQEFLKNVLSLEEAIENGCNLTPMEPSAMESIDAAVAALEEELGCSSAAVPTTATNLGGDIQRYLSNYKADEEEQCLFVPKKWKQPSPKNESSELKKLLTKSAKKPKKCKAKSSKPTKSSRAQTASTKYRPLNVTSLSPPLVIDLSSQNEPSSVVAENMVLSQEEMATHSRFKCEFETWRNQINDERRKCTVIENELENKVQNLSSKKDMLRRLQLEVAKEEKIVKELQASLKRKQQRLLEKENCIKNLMSM